MKLQTCFEVCPPDNVSISQESYKICWHTLIAASRGCPSSKNIDTISLAHFTTTGQDTILCTASPHYSEFRATSPT